MYLAVAEKNISKRILFRFWEDEEKLLTLQRQMPESDVFRFGKTNFPGAGKLRPTRSCEDIFAASTDVFNDDIFAELGCVWPHFQVKHFAIAIHNAVAQDDIPVFDAFAAACKNTVTVAEGTIFH